jgi:hypothetical protein
MARIGRSETTEIWGIPKRNQVIADIPVLLVNLEGLGLATNILTKSGLPKKASDDATHIACATLNGMDY